MYRVYCDGLPLYNDRLESLTILSPTVELEENKTGSFRLYPARRPSLLWAGEKAEKHRHGVSGRLSAVPGPSAG